MSEEEEAQTLDLDGSNLWKTTQLTQLHALLSTNVPFQDGSGYDPIHDRVGFRSGVPDEQQQQKKKKKKQQQQQPAAQMVQELLGGRLLKPTPMMEVLKTMAVHLNIQT
jgi:hypothetical protein